MLYVIKLLTRERSTKNKLRHRFSCAFGLHNRILTIIFNRARGPSEFSYGGYAIDCHVGFIKFLSSQRVESYKSMSKSLDQVCVHYMVSSTLIGYIDGSFFGAEYSITIPISS